MDWGRSVSERFSIRSRKIQLKALEDRFEKLEQDHKDVSKQRDHTLNAQDINNLERQLKIILKNLSKTESEINGLEKEIQEFETTELNTNIPEALQTLVNLLTGIDFKIVAKIYRSCLSQGRPRLVPDTLEALVRQLAEIPGELNEPEPLLHFVSLLIQEPSLANEQRESLRVWATKQGMTILEEKPESSETAEVCLMIKVQPRFFNDPALGYLVSAAISQDPDPLNPEVKPITTPITIPEGVDPKCAPGYGKDELPCVLSKLIATCGGKLHRIPLGDLTVQWFLPIELMSLPIEHWQIQIGRSQQPCSGERCKAVIVRSYDRHFPPYSDAYESVLGDWENAWRRLSSCFHTHCDQALYPLNPMARKTAIDWNNPEVVGCWFIEHTDQQQQEDFWDNLLVQGSPIAFWSRQSESVAATTMQSVRNCSVSELPLSLTRQRQTALRIAIEADRLKAAPLCLLFDNPFRPFPTLDYQSA